MKFLVTKLPENARECPFAVCHTDERLIPNCQLKCNTFLGESQHAWSYTPTRFNCSLHNLNEDLECPYLKSVGN